MADPERLLAELAEEFTEATGRRPWVTELSELLTLEVQSLRGEVIEDLPPRAELRIETVPPAVEPPGGSMVDELDDAAFVAAGDLLAALAETAGATSDAVAVALAALLRTSADGLLADEPPVAVVKISCVAKARAPKPKVGDVVAIPASGERSFLAVVIARNRFGTALGLFRGTHDASDPPTADDHPKPLPHPIYTDDDPVTSGRWRVIGHEPGLLDLFPDDPEIYHYADDESGKPARAETADGDVREVGEDEAREVGLEDESYRQVYLTEQLERRLAASAA